MNFLEGSFFVFLPIFFLVYFCTPRRYRYVVIALGSFVFYGFAGVKMLALLLLSIAITYIGGWVLSVHPTRGWMVFFSILDLGILGVFKYANFCIETVNAVLVRVFHMTDQMQELSLILPIGLSFFIFQSYTYLNDVYRKGMRAEKNPLRFGAFVAFFPTILSGPIQRSRMLLPQIKELKGFSADEAKKGVLLFAWGMFEKLYVANYLALIVNRIYNDFMNYKSIHYLIAAVSFSLYIYADFSSYSDMARGIAKVMGIDVGKNFDNPYTAISCGEFWNRWHQSLNQWFVENIYIPLGGNRKGILRKYFNMMVVFFVSGLWHGAHYNFLVWGVLNGILVVVGYLLMPVKNTLYEKAGVSQELESIRFLKQAGVFALITMTWIFFRNGTRNSIYMIRQILKLDFVSGFDSQLLSIAGTHVSTLITVVSVVVFVLIQLKRKNESESYAVFAKQPMLVQCFVTALLIYICLFGFFMGNVEMNTQFLYFNF